MFHLWRWPCLPSGWFIMEGLLVYNLGLPGTLADSDLKLVENLQGPTYVWPNYDHVQDFRKHAKTNYPAVEVNPEPIDFLNCFKLIETWFGLRAKQSLPGFLKSEKVPQLLQNAWHSTVHLPACQQLAVTSSKLAMFEGIIRGVCVPNPTPNDVRGEACDSQHGWYLLCPKNYEKHQWSFPKNWFSIKIIKVLNKLQAQNLDVCKFLKLNF